jgi:hypothetical protein
MDDWEDLLSFLPKGWEAKCHELGALRRVREFSGPGALLRTLLIHLLDGCSLRETKVRASMAQIADVSDVALLKRLNNSGEWFRWMATQLLGKLPGPIQSRKMRIVDTTVISEPGSTGTDWRVHYAFDFDRMECAELLVTDHTEGETFKNFSIERGTLYVGDRGYFHPAGIDHVVSGGGAVMVRMSVSGPSLYQPAGANFNLLNRLHSLKGKAIGDWPVYFKGKKGRIAGRVCAIRKSSVAAKQAVEKVFQEYSKKQKEPSPATIAGARYVFVFTTLPVEEVPAKTVLELYRSRWQIELVFKRMKSILGVGHLPKQDPEGAKAWIHGKLFCAALLEALINEAQRFSPWGYPLPQAAA